jgi:hypothetical protein
MIDSAASPLTAFGRCDDLAGWRTPAGSPRIAFHNAYENNHVQCSVLLGAEWPLWDDRPRKASRDLRTDIGERHLSKVDTPPHTQQRLTQQRLRSLDHPLPQCTGMNNTQSTRSRAQRARRFGVHARPLGAPGRGAQNRSGRWVLAWTHPDVCPVTQLLIAL